MAQTPGSPQEPLERESARSGEPAAQPPGAASQALGGGFDRLRDVKLRVNVDLGRTTLSIREIVELRRGSIVQLDKLSGEAVDICVDNERLATGEVIVIQDKLRVRVIDIVYEPGEQPQQEDHA